MTTGVPTGHGNGPFVFRQALSMDADTVHTALGLTFTALWLLIGRVLIGDRM